MGAQRAFIDSPRPGRGYLAVCCALVFVFPAVLLGVLASGGAPAQAQVVLLIVSIVPFVIICALLGLAVRAACTTVYAIRDGRLELACGQLARGAVPLEEIRAVERVDVVTRSVGWRNGSGSFCNRFTDGLRLTTAHGIVYLTPTEPSRFAAVLKREA
jgi:hypothetical protein